MIDSHIPIPRPRYQPSYGDLDKLEVGQSVTFLKAAAPGLSPSIAYRQRKTAKRYTRRTEGDRIRVWRVA